jgi:hypothetical protein
MIASVPIGALREFNKELWYNNSIETNKKQ